MSKLTEQEKEKFEQIESGIREESEKMQEILVAIQESWSDPGTELFYKELIRNIHMLKEQSQELRIKIAGIGGEKNDWEKDRDRKA